MTDPTDPERLAGRINAMSAGSLDALLGIRYVHVAPDRVVATVEASDRLHQPFGIVHGGVHCTIVESVASVGAWAVLEPEGRTAVGVHNATDLLRSHREGRLEAVGTPLHLGRRTQLWLTVVTRASDGRPVARGQVRLQVLVQPV